MNGLSRSKLWPVLFSSMTLLGASTVLAEEVFLIQEVPDPVALADMMYPSQTGASKPQYKLRGIRFKKPEVASDDASVQTGGDDAAVERARESSEGTAIGFNIQFDYNSAELSAESLPYLDAVGEMLNLEQTQNSGVLIAGHADASGEDQYNLSLSESRALAVASYIKEKYAIDGARIETIGYGETTPLPGADPLDARNRRVEFHPIQ